MLELIFKESKAVKASGKREARPSVKYIAGFVQFSPCKWTMDDFINAEALLESITAVEVAPEVIVAAKTVVKDFKATVATVKGMSVLQVLQFAHRVKLSKGERAFLLQEMKVVDGRLKAIGLTAKDVLTA